VATSQSGAKQLGVAVSGERDVVTGGTSGSSANANDLDGGSTTLRSRAIQLPADPANLGALTFRYTFAHDAAATNDDAFRVVVEAEDASRTTVYEQLGNGGDRDAAWTYIAVSVDAWAGQTIHVILEAVDGGPDNLVEAAVDDVRIRRE
jgi:aminopeptidase S